jgi:dTDP-4-amino-4,6-dideoxygalactose transaminase
MSMSGRTASIIHIFIASKHDLIVVEDAAPGVNATYQGRFLGTIGDMGCYSFHESKNFVAGEGGAFLTNNESLARRAEIVREKGINRSQFFRGEVDKYTWMDIGPSNIASDLLAAVLLAQLEAMEEITARRGRVYGRYATGLAPLVDAGAIKIQSIPQHCVSWRCPCRPRASSSLPTDYSSAAPCNVQPWRHVTGYRQFLGTVMLCQPAGY